MRYELKIALRYLRARRKDAFISITTIFTAVGVMIGVAALTITLSVMGGFEQSIKERVLSLTPQVQILNSQGSIENYAEIQSTVAKVPGVSGSDAYIVGQAMLSSGRGIGGENGEHRAPLLVIRDGDRDPSLVTVLIGASISTVRSVTRGSVASWFKHTSSCMVVDQRGREILHRAFVLRHVDVLPLAGATAIVERGEQRERGKARRNEIRVRAVGWRA